MFYDNCPLAPKVIYLGPKWLGWEENNYCSQFSEVVRQQKLFQRLSVNAKHNSPNSGPIKAVSISIPLMKPNPCEVHNSVASRCKCMG